MVLNHFTGEQKKKNILENGNSLEEKKNRYRVSKGEHYTFVELPVLSSVWNVGLTQAGG